MLGWYGGVGSYIGDNSYGVVMVVFGFVAEVEGKRSCWVMKKLIKWKRLLKNGLC